MLDLRLIDADVLKLRRRRGMLAVCARADARPDAVAFVVMAIQHGGNPAKYGPAGGLAGFKDSHRGHVADGLHRRHDHRRHGRAPRTSSPASSATWPPPAARAWRCSRRASPARGPSSADPRASRRGRRRRLRSRSPRHRRTPAPARSSQAARVVLRRRRARRGARGRRRRAGRLARPGDRRSCSRSTWCSSRSCWAWASSAARARRCRSRRSTGSATWPATSTTRRARHRDRRRRSPGSRPHSAAGAWRTKTREI